MPDSVVAPHLFLFQKETLNKLETELGDREKSVNEREKKVKQIEDELEKPSDNSVSRLIVV